MRKKNKTKQNNISVLLAIITRKYLWQLSTDVRIPFVELLFFNLFGPLQYTSHKQPKLDRESMAQALESPSYEGQEGLCPYSWTSIIRTRWDHTK